MKKIILISIFIWMQFTSNCQNVTRLGPNYFLAGLNSNSFNYFRMSGTGNQHRDMWCWAACAQMALNYYGLIVTQEQIVVKCFGSQENAPGGAREMFTALSGDAPNIWGRSSTIYSNMVQINAAQIQYALSNNSPLIVLLRNAGSEIGHFNVVSGIYYSLQRDFNGNVISVIPSSVVLRDPYPTNPSRIEMPWATFVNRGINMYGIGVSYN